jgi:hypothetical protein
LGYVLCSSLRKIHFLFRLQVCVAVLLDNFVNASARDEEKERLRKIEEAKSFKVRVGSGSGDKETRRGMQSTRSDTKGRIKSVGGWGKGPSNGKKRTPAHGQSWTGVAGPGKGLLPQA